MTTFLADSASSPNGDGIYPEKQLSTRMGYPSRRDFEVRQTTNGRGNGIVARKRFAPLERMCRVSGLIVSRRRLHTLQILPDKIGRAHVRTPVTNALLATRLLLEQ